MQNLIMPKQTSDLEKFILTLEILYTYKLNNIPKVKNEVYINEMIQLVPSYNLNSDKAMIVKQSELVRYFGFAFRDFAKKETEITEKGIEFYEAYLNKNNIKMLHLIAESIYYNSFGRNNSAIKSSDSDIDPPKLFIKAIIALNGVTKNEFANLLFFTHNKNYDFNYAIKIIIDMRLSMNINEMLPTEYLNKYNDTKFPKFLINIGFCKTIENKYCLDEYIYSNYLDFFNNMSIYNTSNINNCYESLSFSIPFNNLENDDFKKINDRQPFKNNNILVNNRYSTNVRISKTALSLCNYKCNYDNEHFTFIGKNGAMFLEVHHLIPMNAQQNFDINLDCIENVVPLCPNCHSAIHYGDAFTRQNILKKLYNERIQKLNNKGIYISFEDLFKNYYN